jgi:hypothetical protein
MKRVLADVKIGVRADLLVWKRARVGRIDDGRFP